MRSMPPFMSNAVRSALVGTGIVLAAMLTAPSAAQNMEQISMVYEEIEWNAPTTKSRIESDLRSAVAEKRLKVSPTEIAGAAQAAFDAGQTMGTDDWESRTTIRGCGPAAELCVVITCNRCSSGK